jgi:hypothetical protein
MQWWGIQRQPGRTMGLATSMSTSAYGIEAIWEGQIWIITEFYRLMAEIGQDIAATL